MSKAVKKKTTKKSTPKSKSVKKDVVETVEVPDEEKGVACNFVPQKDITSYELAFLMHFLLRGYVTVKDWKLMEEMEENILRHLVPTANTQETDEK